MLISWVVLLVALGGLLLWAFAANAKLAEVGRIAFFCGLFVTCLLLSGRTVRLG